MVVECYSKRLATFLFNEFIRNRNDKQENRDASLNASKLILIYKKNQQPRLKFLKVLKTLVKRKQNKLLRFILFRKKLMSGRHKETDNRIA